MTKLSLATFALLVGFAAAAPLSAAAEPTHVSGAELDQFIVKAQRFVCARFGDSPNCLDGSVTVRIDDDTHGYLAYFHRASRKISLSSGLDSIALQLNLVHELTHAYRDQFYHQEETWLDEGLAKFMEYQYSTVWPVSYQEKIRKRPEFRLRNDEVDYHLNGIGYTSSFFLVLYLYNRFGGDQLLEKLIESKRSGWENILAAITEIRRDGGIQIAQDLVSKPAILRHFALALWLNDPYLAKYALFTIDTQYEPLSKASIEPVEFGPMRLQPGDARIVFSRTPIKTTEAAEAYAISSKPHASTVISSLDKAEHADVFVYIFY